MSGKLVGAAVAAVAVPLTLVVGIGLGSAAGTAPTSPQANVDPSCLSATGSGMDTGRGEILNDSQARNAQIIYQVSIELELPARAAVIAIATSMQEDRLRNSTTPNDRDSLGLFQQRPSQGWGTPQQLIDPVHASKKFYAALVKVPNWQTIPLTQAAQAVQRSGTPDAYAQWEPFATKIVTAFAEKAATCPTVAPPSDLGAAILAQAQKWNGMAYQYGGGDQNGPSVGTNSNGSGQPGFDCSGLTVWAVYQATNGKVLLPRTAATQFQDRRWKHVPYDQLQVGDLVFWPGSSGTGSAPSHVGIYAGDQRFFNAPFTGANLRFDSMAPGTYRQKTFIAGARITG
ncbi:C40 family peptidase [Sphaerisporangium sp. NPDC049003]|uniref:C40 family peptidase n=1 Tax=Sphaerisporangium sp. NPDC049003 TaxID=3364517 RepID=UPI00371C59AE